MENVMEYAIFAIFVILQVLDIYSTVKALGVGGREANPFVKKIMDLIGVLPALVILKVIVIVLIVASYIYFPLERTILSILIGIVCIGYAYIVYMNFKIGRAEE